MNMNLPIFCPPNVGAATPAETQPVAKFDLTVDTEVPSDVKADCSHISVYFDSATSVSYDENAPDAAFDVVLTVTIRNPETEVIKSYKKVKRIALNKVKLALEVENDTPETVIEGEDPEVVKAEMDAYFAAAKARRLAGLEESRGTNTATVLFSFKDNSKSQKEYEANGGAAAIATSKVTLPYIKDKAHARHVFDSHYAWKYENPKITRITITPSKE